MKRLLLTLLAAAAALLLLGAPTANAATTIDIIPGDPLGCDTKVPMSVPGSGVIGVDKGPKQRRTGDPFAAKPTVSMYEVYGYAGLDWVNHDLGCGPDAVRDTDASIAGAWANFSWSTLQGAAATSTAMERWTYDPDTLDVFEPIQRVAAEALGNRVFMSMFGMTLVVVGGYVILRSRSGDVREGVNYAGWALLMLTAAMSCLIYGAKIAPAADSTVLGIVASVNAGVAGTTTDNYSIADASAANTQRGILYSTWASGTFGRNSGPAVEKYGPALFRNGALTFDEAKLLSTDPEAAKAIIEKKAGRFRAAAENLKADDPIAYEHLAGKHNMNRVKAASVGWIAFLCVKAYNIVSSVLLLFALVVIRVIVWLLPVLVIAGAYYPARHIILKIGDYGAGSVAAAVMFGCASAVFTGIAGGVLSPTTNTPLELAAFLMFIVTIAGWFVTKPLRSFKSFAMPGASRYRGDPTKPPVAPTPEQPPAPDTPYTRPPTPAARPYTSAPYQYGPATGAPSTQGFAPTKPGFVKATVVGAAQGAATGATLAAITGGVSVATGAATGAARAGAATAATHATGSPIVGAAAGFAAGKAIPVNGAAAAAAAPEIPAGVAAQNGTPPAPALAPAVEQPVRSVVEASRVWTPGEENPSAHLNQAPSKRGVYKVFTPEEVKS